MKRKNTTLESLIKTFGNISRTAQARTERGRKIISRSYLHECLRLQRITSARQALELVRAAERLRPGRWPDSRAWALMGLK